MVSGPGAERPNVCWVGDALPSTAQARRSAALQKSHTRFIKDVSRVAFGFRNLDNQRHQVLLAGTPARLHTANALRPRGDDQYPSSSKSPLTCPSAEKNDRQRSTQDGKVQRQRPVLYVVQVKSDRLGPAEVGPAADLP